MSQDRKEVTKDIFPYIYAMAVSFHTNKSDKLSCVNKLVLLGMNKTTASRYIVALDDMLNGKSYKSTMSLAATEYFLNKILDDFGGDILFKALFALKQHIVYYEVIRNVNRVGFGEIY